MDGIRGEVSNKIRSAIKAKLMELGAYVDDELPDYIMVMVANKRSQQQMEDDLQLFLGDSTSTFTNWLHTVLSKLQQVTVNSADMKKNADKKRPSEDHRKEKKKKLKKDKDKEKTEKNEKTPENIKLKEKLLEEPPLKTVAIKQEPVEIAGQNVLIDTSSSKHNKISSSSASSNQKRPPESKNDDDEDDDFINLKADVEADMWGDPDESSSNKIGNSESKSLPPSSNVIKTGVPKNNEDLPNQSQPGGHTTISAPQGTTSPSLGTCASKTVNSDQKSAPRIIKISESIRQEQETLKSSAKVTKDSQALVKRVFQSHIVSQRNSQDKSKLSRRSSPTADKLSRRSDLRLNRKHEQQDLRETIRQERQKEREHGRDRDREHRRSRESRKSHPGIASIVRSSSTENRENSNDPSILSVVRVKPRPHIPASMQANRSLILKAVAEAQKSVSKVSVRSEVINALKSSRNTTKETTRHSSFKKESTMTKQSPHLPSREALKRMSFTVLGKDSTSREQHGTEMCNESAEGSIILDPSLNILIQVPTSPGEEDVQVSSDPIQTEKVRRWIKDVEEATKVEIVPPGSNPDSATTTGVDAETCPDLDSVSKHPSDEDVDDIDDVVEVDTSSLKTSGIHSGVISESQIHKKASRTQFVVTLDGLDPMVLRSFTLDCDRQVESPEKVPLQSIDDCANQEDDENMIREELVKEQLLRQELLRQQAAVRELKAAQHPTVTAPRMSTPLNPAVKRAASPTSPSETRPSKVLSAAVKTLNTERCKFWPACKNGENCEFYHPVTSCKLFPTCKFGDHCLYIHPTCRFNIACTRSDCPFTHTGLRTNLSTPASAPGHIPSQTIKQACKFFPNCNNLSCPYIHPTVCKFGTRCTKPKCQFIHSDKALITKHKWVRH